LIIIVFIIVCFLLFMFPLLRCALSNPFSVIKYSLIDFKKYIKYKRWNECSDFGKIIMYTGLFGRGKTLSAVHRVIDIYNKYNGKKVFNFKNMSWEVQEIKILSNVEINIPFIKLESAEQIVNCSNMLENESSVCIVLIDEASTQFNSRNFKTNISSTLLNSMLTCRHHKFGMFLTAQRFNHVDALIRQITESVVECRKIWRFQLQYVCSAWDLENCTNIKLVDYVARCWFVRNKDYSAYDTSAVVDDIKRKQANGELLTDQEVLNNQGNQNLSEFNVSSKKMKRIIKG